MSLVFIDQMRIIDTGNNDTVEWIVDDPAEKIVSKVLDKNCGTDGIWQKKKRVFVDDNEDVSSLMRYHVPQKFLIEKRDMIDQIINGSFKNNYFPRKGVFCVWVGWKNSQLFFLPHRKRIDFIQVLPHGIMDPIKNKITEAYYIDEFFNVPVSKVFDCLTIEGGLLDLIDVVIDCKPEVRGFFKKLSYEIDNIEMKKGNETKKVPILFCGPGAEIMPSIPGFFISQKHKYAQESMKNWTKMLIQ